VSPRKSAEVAVGKPACSVRVVGFVRPFTLKAAKELMTEWAAPIDDGFWMNAVKSECVVTFASKDDARRTQEGVHHMQWPPVHGRVLEASFSEITAAEARRVAEQPKQRRTPPPSREAKKAPVVAPLPVESPPVTLDDLFRKTATKPVLYWLPVSDEEVTRRKESLPQEKKEE
jgi:apoptotic chromatin condensation inducer in the nucleus